MITFATFWCYTKLAHQELRIPVAFSAMATFQMVQQPLFDLPGKVMFFLRTRVSVRRLDRFLSEDDLQDTAPVTWQESYHDISPTGDNGRNNGNGNVNGDSHKPDSTLAFHDSTHIYPQQQVRDETVEPFTLTCSDITFPEGKLTIVYGDNASGKSSLLMACLGGG